jgi:hypothetical protein
MTYQPMGVSGIDLDITTGRPRQPKTQEEHMAELEARETKAQQELAQLSQELPLVLPILARQLEIRIKELMSADPTCLSILKVIGALRMKVEAGPQVVNKLRRQSFGPMLNSLTDESKVE